MNSSIDFPAHKIKEEDGLSDIIDLDSNKTAEDLAYEWDSKVRLKFKNYSIVDSEQSLDTLMKWYIQIIQEAMDIEDFQILKVLTAKHIQFFKLYFVELNCCFVDNYLDNMEEILAFYSNLEVKSIPVKKKNGNKRAFKKCLLSVCQRLISILNLYLLTKEDRMYHVVMKIKLNSLSEESKDLLNLLYGKLLTKEPNDKSDLGFCRAYILYQKWKTVKKTDWEKMDSVMYNLYNRTPECIKTNETLSQILLPQNNSVLDILIHVSEKHVVISEEYFKFIKSKKSQEDSIILPDISNIEIQDQIIPDLMNNSEDGELDRAYHNFVKTMSSLSQLGSDKISDECGTLKIEEDEDDDDCQIVGVSSFGYDSESTELVHEILEDEDDIEIIYFKKKEQTLDESNKKEKSELSFLDSIEIPDPSDVPKEKVSSSTNAPLILSRVCRNVVTTSTSTSTNSPRCSPSLKKSRTRNLISSISTSNIQKRTKLDKVSNRSSVTTNFTSLEIDGECTSNAPNDLVYMEYSEKSSIQNRVRSVIDMQTQTDLIQSVTNDFNENSRICNDVNCPGKVIDRNKSRTLEVTYCTSCCYGLVTPPSDRPLDEHVPPAGSNPNVYAKIVRTHNDQNETEHIAKVLDYSVDKTVEILPASSEINKTDLSLSLIEQKCNNTENQNSSCKGDTNIGSKIEFETSIEPTTKKKPDNLDKSVNSTDGCLNYNDSDLGTLVNTVEEIMDNIDQDEEMSTSSHEHVSNLIGEGCSDQEVIAENIINKSLLCTDLNISCRSTDTPSSNRIISSDILPSRTPSPSNYNDIFKTPVSSAVVPCTSTDIVTSQDDSSKSSDTPSSNRENKFRNVSCPSPDITSTSTDIQDFHESLPLQDGDSGEVEVEYEHYGDNMSVTEDSECNVDTGNIKNNENVSQSNLEVGEEMYVEYTIVINSAEELSNVNICMDNHFNESSVHSDLSNGIVNEDSDDIVQSEQVKSTNEESIPVAAFKELKVTVEKLNEVNCGGTANKKVDGSPKKIMFTSSEKVGKTSVDEFSKFEETVHLHWNKLKETHDLDEIFSGPVTKVNGVSNCINPDTNFDLFNSKVSEISGENPSQINSSGSSGEVISPEYEEIDDFKSYYEENKNSGMLGLSPIQNKLISGGDQNSNSATPLRENNLHHHNKDNNNIVQNSFKTKPPANGKRMRIAFAEHVIDTSNTISHSPPENTSDALQGILKKTLTDGDSMRQIGKRTRPRIPRRLMNLKSLSQFNVKPNDPCIQGVPCVVIERLSDSEISQWLRVSEISRKVRLQKQQARFASNQLTCRVDYDKQTPHINENDVLRYNTPEGITTISVPQTLELRHWRSSAILQSKSNKLDEGTVEKNCSINFNDDYNIIPAQCKSTCCSSLTTDITNLNVSTSQSEIVLNLSCCNTNSNLKCFGPCCLIPKPNPFLLKNETPEKIFSKSKHNYCDISNLIQSDQQPAIVPEVDLYNLNLRKFSPSPVLNCFSSPSSSPSHIFPSDTCSIEKAPLLPLPKSFDLNTQLYEDVASFTNSTASLANSEDIISVSNITNTNDDHADSSKMLPYSSYNFENEINTNHVMEVTYENDVKSKEEMPDLSENLSKIEVNILETEAETRLPLKKRKLSVANAKEEMMDDDYIGPDLVEEIIKRARAEEIEKEDISYPAKPMISIAEIQEKLVEPHPRVFKTPAERKEMPPSPVQTFTNPSESPRIITEQYNNHTYNNPTINYHMNNVPYPFFPCASLPYFPPILLPINSTTFDMNLVNAPQSVQQQSTIGQEPVVRSRRERRTRGRKKNA